MADVRAAFITLLFQLQFSQFFDVMLELLTRQVTTVVQKVVKRTSGQPPKFVRPIQPCVVREGDSCEFTAAVSGVPVPEISWLKDKVDLVLVPGHHVASFNPETGECSLVINQAQPADVGVYSCRATNVAGRATCTANVVVVRKTILFGFT